MTRILVLALAAARRLVSARAERLPLRRPGRPGVVLRPAAERRAVHERSPLGGSGPSTVPQGAVPTQPLPSAMTPSTSAPSTIPSSAVPAPGSLESTPGRVVPGTVGPDSPDRRFGLSADEQRIDRDAAQRNITQGERAREAEAVRLNVPTGRGGARRAATSGPTSRPGRRRASGATCRPVCPPTSRRASAKQSGSTSSEPGGRLDGVAVDLDGVVDVAARSRPPSSPRPARRRVRRARSTSRSRSSSPCLVSASRPSRSS